MGIWSSVDISGPDVTARDLHDPAIDEYQATGVAEVIIDVATATSWNRAVRLALGTDDDHIHVCLVLDSAEALLLRERIDEALRRIEAAGIPRG